MRAAVLEKPGETPVVRDFEEPDGKDVVDVRLAGCNPVDLALASGAMGDPGVPKVVGKEGVGLTAEGARVYFDSPPSPFGSWAQRVRVDPAKVYPVPEGVDDDLAVALGIAGLAAWLPLTRHAHKEGKSVLILGATGVVGNIAVQAAKLLYAARVIAAGRDADALEKTRDLGADAVVQLEDDTPYALRNEAGEGYDVVIDMVYGDPFLAALDATALGATLITVGQGAGSSADIPFRKLMGRTHIGHLNDAMPPEVVRAAYEELTAHAAEGRIRVETTRYPLADAAEAWQAQADSPHSKIAVVPE
ncbi:quinone oxidoreductase family protein [Mycolicibacterium frederiksbergense]|uniref:Zinc-binding alcohol dehydrogenase family protein n=1 Tax=Mycolicibacterium frederiksbergense TaxID=117567 RepID=A0A6H0S4K1_9MYCO|nr:zinc-binding alcohol dehydrogenase family protein [Mycolicibacterium frederiksbergense]QIV82086.1 zinc-binding alcohol dehydrogenase family protein [Mycolicibacterium frederiksbergense]